MFCQTQMIVRLLKDDNQNDAMEKQRLAKLKRLPLFSPLFHRDYRQLPSSGVKECSDCFQLFLEHFFAAGRRVTAVSGASSHRVGDSQWQTPACLSYSPKSPHPHVMPSCPWLSHASCWCSHTMPPPTGRAMPPMPVAARCLMPAPEVGILASGIKHPIPPPVPGNQDVAGEFVKICIFDLAIWETELS